ncbi:alpha/beta hydrolase family protein [Nocardia transvalensis]|uniref:alpha/beta hydrolase family protein n=1 Tax=Nocardia transvalensis TaxID=37333 RepID=UPI00189353D2|nr:alpha/beta hydrolase family protein [Nocardia transvalensis]MBF6330845.1 alpha/beta fold hydrolase [Nocardia transvalensis]
MATVLFVDGTWHVDTSRPDKLGMLRSVADALLPDIERETVLYPAVYGWPTSYRDSVNEGTANLRRAIDLAEGPVYLVGYSQGATIAGELAEHTKVSRTYLFADPHRPARRYVGDVDPGGCGLAGPRWRDATVHYFALPGDPITAAPMDSPLRDLADFTDAMGPNAIEWFSVAASKLLTGDWQNSIHRPERFGTEIERYRKAAADAQRYLNGWHAEYWRQIVPGTNVTFCQWAANSINFLEG